MSRPLNSAAVLLAFLCHSESHRYLLFRNELRRPLLHVRVLLHDGDPLQTEMVQPAADHRLPDQSNVLWYRRHYARILLTTRPTSRARSNPKTTSPPFSCTGDISFLSFSSSSDATSNKDFQSSRHRPNNNSKMPTIRVV
jgi:hypothetical protein